MKTTCCVIKPDAVRRCLIGPIITDIEYSGFYVVAMKMVHLSCDEAQEFYAEHKGKPFFEGLIASFTAGPIVPMIIECRARDTAGLFRVLCGGTDPHKAEKHTLRCKFGLGVPENSVHASADAEAAVRDIAFFFKIP